MIIVVALKAAEQETLIDVRITECGAAQATGTIENRNPEATRVSIVIWWTPGGGEPLRTGVAHATLIHGPTLTMVSPPNT